MKRIKICPLCDGNLTSFGGEYVCQKCGLCADKEIWFELSRLKREKKQDAENSQYLCELVATYYKQLYAANTALNYIFDHWADAESAFDLGQRAKDAIQEIRKLDKDFDDRQRKKKC